MDIILQIKFCLISNVKLSKHRIWFILQSMNFAG